MFYYGVMCMPMDKDRFLKQFSQQALDERISLFLGAGCSCDAGYPDWSSLFSPLAKELGVPDNSYIDYYHLAQYYSNSFGESELRKHINERINKNNFKSPLIDQLIDIGFNNIWTTNFDNSIERNYQERGILINKIFRDSDFSNIDINKRINIFKMNGDIANLNNIVATQNDYEKYEDTHKIMLMFFKRELISNTFLFIGYSFLDHLVLECLSEINRYLGSSSVFHYTIMKNNSDDPYFVYFIKDLEQRYHVRVLLVDEYSEIPCVLSELNDKIRKKRVFISGAFSSQKASIEEFSHCFSKQLSAKLLDNDYRIVNGIGRRFGTHLIGYSIEHLAKQGVKNIEKHIIIKPFVGNDSESPAKKKLLRKKIIQTCGAAIFIFGEAHDNLDFSKSGVFEEFELANEHNKTIIPIAYPNMVSEYIWQYVKENITRYPYLEKVIDLLSYNVPIARVVECIIQILDSIRDI